MNILSRLEKRKECWPIFFILSCFILLRIPSLIEPYWYGDEGIYEVLGAAMRQGRVLYTQIWDNKPPLLYVLYMLFGSDQFSIRLLSLLIGTLTVIAFFILSEKLFQKVAPRLIATSVFAFLFATPLLEGNIANAENFMLLPIIIAGYIVFSRKDTFMQQDKRVSVFLIAGILLGISFLLKIVALFDLAAFITFIFTITLPTQNKNIFMKTTLIRFGKGVLPILVGFTLPLLLTTLYFMLHRATGVMIHAILFSNVGYVGYGNTFLIPQGLLILKLALLGGFLSFIVIKRKQFTDTALLISIWFAFSLFNAFFSGRPYTHYVLVLLPSFALLLGLFFEMKKRQQIIIGVCLLASVVLLRNAFRVYSPIKAVAYYQNFAEFIMKKKSVESYQSFFDRNTPRDYEIAYYLKDNMEKTDSFYVWGNNAQVYALTKRLPPGRYTVAYHVTSQKNAIDETAIAIATTAPRYIIIMPNASYMPFSLPGYMYKVTIKDIGVYERAY